MRLPRLIGFRKALPFLVSGQAMNSKTALKLGVVDHLFSKTQTISTSAGCTEASYDYQWLSSILLCMESRKIGSKPFVVKKRDSGATAVSAVVDVRGEGLTLDIMASSITENWEECEKKAERKYPSRGGFVSTVFQFFLNSLLLVFTFFQLWKKVGFGMPAPYTCLLTTFGCLYAGNWRQAMALNAHGLTRLITGAESTSLMMLFLVTRKLKKLAVGFGLRPSESAVSFAELGCAVMVYVSSDMLHLSLPFVQSLLYNGIVTSVVLTDKTADRAMVTQKIRAQFNYALKRNYISSVEMEEKMKLLSLCSKAEVVGHMKSGDFLSVIVINASTCDFSLNELTSHYSKVHNYTYNYMHQSYTYH